MPGRTGRRRYPPDISKEQFVCVELGSVGRDPSLIEGHRGRQVDCAREGGLLQHFHEPLAVDQFQRESRPTQVCIVGDALRRPGKTARGGDERSLALPFEQQSADEVADVLDALGAGGEAALDLNRSAYDAILHHDEKVDPAIRSGRVRRQPDDVAALALTQNRGDQILGLLRRDIDALVPIPRKVRAQLVHGEAVVG